MFDFLTDDDGDGLGALPSGGARAGRGQRAVGVPVGLAGEIANDSRFGDNARLLEVCDEKSLCLAKAIAYFILEGLRRNATSTVRLPAHCMPPAAAQTFDFGIKDAAVTIAAGATGTVVLGQFPTDWAAYLSGFSWAVSWTSDNPQTTDSPYDNARVRVLANGSALRGLQAYSQVARNVGAVAPKAAIEIPVSGSSVEGGTTAPGSRLELEITNLHSTESIDALGRLQGWMFPSHGGGGQGAAGGLAGIPEG